MAVYIRLDDAVRARLRGDGAGGGGTSSGSDHDASACLSGLVQAFLETDAGGGEEGSGTLPKGGDGDDSDDGDGPGRAAAAAASVRELLDPPAGEDPFRIRLAAAVAAAMEAEAALRAHGAAFRRAVMRRLRAAGYDAGVCKSRWEASGGITAGTYEYVDVVTPPAAKGQRSRYIVDADFRAGLEVARATAEYAVVVAAVPASAVVAREEAVGRAVRVAADAARRSLRSHSLHVPPWRKSRYMLAKWLGPYKRSTATSSPARPMPGPGAAGMDVKCRAVGFSTPPAASPAARIK